MEIRILLSKVPQITVWFWLIKIMGTTVGETAADAIDRDLGLGLGVTSGIMFVLFAIVFAYQMTRDRYIPWVYWLTVVLISIVGTLITDNLTDTFGVPLLTSTVLFSVLLGIVFLLWYRSEGTLSIHSIYSTRREAFYWAAVLSSFALGTAAGDLIAEKYAIGYWKSAVVFAAVIAISVVLYKVLSINSVLTFWVVYIVTRPLGASLGDLLTQSKDSGGLGISNNLVSLVFAGLISLMVAYLTISKVDQEPAVMEESSDF